jgi:hypothetical protein
MQVSKLHPFVTWTVNGAEDMVFAEDDDGNCISSVLHTLCGSRRLMQSVV